MGGTFLLAFHRFVISTEGEAEVEKPAVEYAPEVGLGRYIEMQVSPLHDGRTVAPVEMTIL